MKIGGVDFSTPTISKKQVEIKNLLKDHGNLYQFAPKDSLVDIFAYELEQFELSKVKDALNALKFAGLRSYPTLKDIRDKIPFSNSSDRRKLSLDDVKGNCTKCGNSGSISLKQKGDPLTEYAFQCTCPRGEIMYPAFPKITNEIRDTFYSEFLGGNK